MIMLARVRTPLALLALLVLVGSACAGNATDEAAKDTKQAPIAGKPVEGPQKIANLDGEVPPDAKPYTVKIESVSGKVGEPGQVKISVVPDPSWHVNLEYPTQLSVEVPAGVEVTKATQSKGDALALTEQNCEFGVGYTASEAGEKAFTGEIKFAVCQDTACVPKSETLAFAVAVE